MPSFPTSPIISPPSRGASCGERKAFSLLELMATMALIAVLVVCAWPFVMDGILFAQQTVDHHDYAIYNDALTRYKGGGGNLNALTVGAPISHIITALRTPVNWTGMTHSFLDSSYTVPGRSLSASGNGSNYYFYRYNTYNDGTFSAGSDISSRLSGAGNCAG